MTNHERVDPAYREYLTQEIAQRVVDLRKLLEKVLVDDVEVDKIFKRALNRAKDGRVSSAKMAQQGLYLAGDLIQQLKDRGVDFPGTK